MKRYLALLCALLCLLSVFTSCQSTEDDEKIQILCTVFPIYDWVRSVVGESDTVEVSLLVADGSDLHSYQPSAADLLRIGKADLFCYVGGTSDAWVEEALRAHPSESRKDLKLLALPELPLREISAESAHSHESTDEHEHGATDEHIWLSLVNAQICLSALTEEICTLDPLGAEHYRENRSAYSAELTALHQEYAALATQADHPLLLFADRFPFIYLLEDYGIDYLAAFAGCSADIAATPETILRLAHEMDEHSLSVIMITEDGNDSLAISVRNATQAKNQQILILNSMQSVTQKNISDGTTYLSLMRSNLDQLRAALLPLEA